ALFCAQLRVLGAEEIIPHWTRSGTHILGPDSKPIHLRGFDVLWWVPVTDQDASDIRKLGANCVRYMFGYNPKGTYDPDQVKEVEQHIRYFTSRGVWVIPVLYEFEKPDPAHPKQKLGPWSTPEMNAEFLAMWADLMGRLKNDPFLAAWEPINEPHDVVPSIAAGWYRKLLPKFRAIDPARPIVVEGANYSHAEDLTDEFKLDDANIIYAFHFYDPYDYTTDLRNPPLAYPGPWGRSFLEKIIQPAIHFRDKYQVPVWCGEWGVKTGAPGYDLWLRDTFSILEANKLDWCIWAWALQPRDPQNQSFDINKTKAPVYRVIVDLFGSMQSPEQP
ncbi:MAG TPA: cellulase family glycosylhydrolase, partial [Candidatus Methylacidiphilales bacterium]